MLAAAAACKNSTSFEHDEFRAHQLPSRQGKEAEVCPMYRTQGEHTSEGKRLSRTKASRNQIGKFGAGWYNSAPASVSIGIADWTRFFLQPPTLEFVLAFAFIQFGDPAKWMVK
jgi:hypothetical protein